jgi:hypothetical protein
MTGVLTQTVLDYVRMMEELVPTAKTTADWAPLAEFVAVDEFERVGTFLEVQNWDEYVDLLCRWGSFTASFETTVRRISELPGVVYYEVQERHVRGDDVSFVNSMTVFAFDHAGKIIRLDVYLQQAR